MNEYILSFIIFILIPLGILRQVATSSYFQSNRQRFQALFIIMEIVENGLMGIYMIYGMWKLGRINKSEICLNQQFTLNRVNYLLIMVLGLKGAAVILTLGSLFICCFPCIAVFIV